MDTIAAFWMGRPWSLLERAAALSYIKHGYHYVLYCYHPVGNLLPGIKVADAREIWDVDYKKVRPHPGFDSVAPFSDLFRYKILQHVDDVTVVGSDVFCLRRFPDSNFLYGLVNKTRVSDNVLRFPKDSELMEKVLQLSRPLEDRYDKVPWTTTGMILLQAAMQQTGTYQYALPEKSFSPVPASLKTTPFESNKWLWLLDDPEVYAVHLYHTGVVKAGIDINKPVVGSLYHKLTEGVRNGGH